MNDTRRAELRDSLPTVDRLLQWEKTMTHQKYAETFVHLPKTNAVGAGKPVDFSRSPHLIKPMQALDNPKIQEVFLMFASQMAKTLFLFIAWSHNAKMNPKTVVWMIPKDKMIGRYQKEKITELVNSSPALKAIIEETRVEEKRAQNKGGIIAHQGATTYLIGSMTDDDKKAVTAKLIIADEIDEFKEGLASIAPLVERGKTFIEYGGKLLAASTKKSKDSPITKGFNSCEQKNYLTIECPHCSEFIEPSHTQFIVLSEKDYKEMFGYTAETFTDEVIYEKYLPYAAKTAYYECNVNGCKINTEEKNKQILDFKIGWYVKGNKINPSTVGFSANSFLSFFVPYEEIARKWLKAQLERNPTERKRLLELLYEGYFNDTFEQEAKETLKKNDILLLSNGLEERVIPEDSFKVYLTIDTQLTHFWWTIHSWEYGSKPNLVDYGRAESFDELDTIRKQTLVTQHGEIKPINRVTIDRLGDKKRTTLVDEWIKNIVITEGREDYIYATEGVSGKNMTTVHAPAKHKTIPEIKIIKVNNLMAKDYAHDLITRSIERVKALDGDDKLEKALNYEDNLYFINQKPVRLAEEKTEAGLKSVREDFERMMSSEHKTYAVDQATGKVDKEESWIKRNSSVRNDYWDCFIYSIANWNMDSGYIAEKPKELSRREIKEMEDMIAYKKSPQQHDHF